MSSLRTRLSFLLALSLVGGLLLFGSAAYVLFVRQQQQQLAALLTRDLARAQALFQDPAIGASLTAPQEGFVQQLISASGQVILPTLPQQAPLPLYTTPTLDRSGEQPLLISSTPWLSANGLERGTIRTGLDIRDALRARRTLLNILLSSGALIATLIALTSLLLLRRSLKPLAGLAEQAKGIDPASPKLASYQGPEDEVAAVAQALNNALDGIRARQEAERASLAEVAHELAAPLTLVSGHLTALERKQPGDAQLKAASEAAKELLYTSKDLLTLARGELERNLDIQILDLTEVAERIAREYPGVRLGTLDTAEVAASPERLTQLTRNLVRNAVQASGSLEKVMLSVTKDGDQVKLQVADEGPGIAPEDLPHLFERFYTRRGGVGVGLSVAKQIAEQHGGDLTVQSEPEQGAVFTLRLPLLKLD